MNTLNVKLKYGKNGVEASIPAGPDIFVLDPGKVAPLPDQQKLLKEKLARPSGSKSLRSLAESASRACIVVSDKTRHVPYRMILPEPFACPYSEQVFGMFQKIRVVFEFPEEFHDSQALFLFLGNDAIRTPRGKGI